MNRPTSYVDRAQLNELGFVRQNSDEPDESEYVRFAIQACIGTVKQLGGGRSVPMRFNKYRDVIQELQAVIDNHVPEIGK